MTGAALEIRFPALVLGFSPGARAWLRIARTAPLLEPKAWTPRQGACDRALALGSDGAVVESIEIPRLVRLDEVEGRLIGYVARVGGESLVGTRARAGAPGFDLRDAEAWTEHGAVAATASRRHVVVGGEGDEPAPLWDLVSAERVGAYAPRRTQQFFWATDAERVYVSSVSTAAWRRSGQPLWTEAAQTSASAGIAAYAGDVWRVARDATGDELVCHDGESGRITRRAGVPTVHSLLPTAAGLLVGHALGVSLIRGRAARPSSLLKARVDAVATDDVGWAAIDRESQRLYLAPSFKATAVAVDLGRDPELDLAGVASGMAILRPLSEMEEERTAQLLGEERAPRIGHVLIWMPLAGPKKKQVGIELPWRMAELAHGSLEIRASRERRLGTAAELGELTLSAEQQRLGAALERHGLVPRAWQKKVEAALLSSDDAGRLGSVLAGLYADAADKGHRVGFWSCDGLRRRGATGLVVDLERVLKDEAVRVRKLVFDADETTLVLAQGRGQVAIELGVTDDALDVARALDAALEAAGSARRLLLLDCAPPARAFLLRAPEDAPKMKRAGLKGIGKPA